MFRTAFSETARKSCEHDDPEPEEHLTYIVYIMFLLCLLRMLLLSRITTKSTLLFIKLLTAGALVLKYVMNRCDFLQFTSDSIPKYKHMSLIHAETFPHLEISGNYPTGNLPGYGGNTTATVSDRQQN
ncbi:conserved hypothetical protein [Trichinella spiralis]|uniref:hypothetical protein n=1 Tax=Trichinella spiralis TaxID=6334 RepID=UPI0001EFD2E9|nr:conserved hypothetical protein [Trichinella spiralis]